MSLLHDADYVISHLRATYLEACSDGVGERIIRPSHLYITKTGPKRLNWAASTLISKARPESPPIPTDTLTRAMPPMRSTFDDDDDVSVAQLRKGVKSYRRRRRASTLPSLHTGLGGGDIMPMMSKSSSSEDTHPSNLDNGLNTVYEDESDAYEDDSDGYEGEEDDEEENEDGIDALSGLSDEDDSDIEEDLQFIAQQIKRNANGDADSFTSESRPTSATTSPKAKRRRDPNRRQRSLDTSGSPGQFTKGSSSAARPRAMSSRSGNSDTNWPHRDSDSTTATNFSERMQQENTNNNNNRERSASQMSGPSIMKPQAIKPISQVSNLTNAILAKQATFDNPLEQYIAASGKSERRPIKLKMYMPSSDNPRTAWEAVVRADCTTHLAIGFALYCYSEQNRTPELTINQCDANNWNLRIVEDDGEPDEDFPALDRTRQISAYSFDEFALVPATPEQAKENERKTPNTKKPQVQKQQQQQSRQYSEKDDEPDTTEVKVFQYPFNEMTSPLFWEDEVSVEMYVGELLHRVCEEKLLDHSMYAFKIVSTRVVIGNETKLGTLQGQYTLELTPKRVMTKANGYIEPKFTDSMDILDSFNTRTQNVYTALALRGQEEAKRDRKSMLAATAVPEVLNTSGYRKYMVWRRQPMSFINRHERILALDGEYVHIMPSEDKTFFESPKTSSFHIRQVLKCKQSRKVPSNFKIVVRKDSGPKRYDLEAPTATQASEIVAKIRSLAASYKDS